MKKKINKRNFEEMKFQRAQAGNGFENFKRENENFS